MSLLLIAIGLSVVHAGHSWPTGSALLLVLVIATPGVIVDLLLLKPRGGDSND